MIRKRTIAIITAASITFSSIASVLANAETKVPEKKQYVIITEDKEIYEEISEKVSESITNEASVLEENQIIVAELTEKEAETLNAEKDILVEEDIILSGSTVEDSIEEMEEEELTAEEAKKRKEEIKQKRHMWKDVGAEQIIRQQLLREVPDWDSAVQ